MSGPVEQAPRKSGGEECRNRADARPAPSLRIPLTPMIDVTFQLLLFFLLAFTFREAEGAIPGSLPAVEKKPGEKSFIPPDLRRPLVIFVNPVRGSVVYEISGQGGTLRNSEELYRRLIALRGLLESDVPVQVAVRRDVRWEYAVEAYNQAVRAKFKSIAFLPGR